MRSSRTYAQPQANGGCILPSAAKICYFSAMKILYYDCFAGISGDMNLGALIDLGVDPDFLRKELQKLPVHGYSLTTEKASRRGISGTRVQVSIDPEHLRLFRSGEAHEHPHPHSHSHSHTPPHPGKHHHHHHTFAEISSLISQSSLSDSVKSASLAIFTRIAEAEAKIHGKPIDQVHFHEVGAVDSIVDIVGAAICLHHLAPDRIISSTIELGGGMVNCAHGTYPVPAPATSEILHDIPVRLGTVDYETTTPTGAAILAACAHEFSDSLKMKILKTGYGIGTRDKELPNVLRIHLAETGDDAVPSGWMMLECNLDDMNPEFYEYAMDALFEAGAQDVYLTPIQMKKNRPAVKLSVLCDTSRTQALKEILFRETTTLGIRSYGVQKDMLQRKTSAVQTPYGEVRIKSAWQNGKPIRFKPEYADCARLARENNIAVQQVFHLAVKAMENNGAG